MFSKCLFFFDNNSFAEWCTRPVSWTLLKPLIPLKHWTLGKQLLLLLLLSCEPYSGRWRSTSAFSFLPTKLFVGFECLKAAATTTSLGRDQARIRLECSRAAPPVGRRSFDYSRSCGNKINRLPHPPDSAAAAATVCSTCVLHPEGGSASTVCCAASSLGNKLQFVFYIAMAFQ